MQTSSKVEKGTRWIEPIRESVITLVMRLGFVYILIDAFFFGIVWGLYYMGFHANGTPIFILLAIRTMLQIVLIIGIVLEWINDVAYLADTHLIQHHGIFNVREKTYDLQIIRSITVQQNIVGKLLDYGDMDIKTSASGGYNDDIYMPRVPHPYKCKEIFEHLLDDQHDKVAFQ